MHWIKNIRTQPEEFIDRFMGGQHGDEKNQKVLRDKFMCGYCWHFAHILKDTFGRGEVCWAAPENHFVWEDEDKSAYDIEGRYEPKEHGCFYLIPEAYAEGMLPEFLHNGTECAETFAANDGHIEIIKAYCEKTKTAYDKEIEKWFFRI